MKLARMGIALAAVAAFTGVGAAAPASAAPAPGTADLVIVKNTQGGADGAFLFSLSSEAGGQVATGGVSTSGGTGTTTLKGITPGTYTLNEVQQAGWEFVSVDCGTGVNTDVPNQQVTLVADQTLTCTYVNKSGLSLSKLVTSGPTLVAGRSDQFDIGYTLTLINSSAVSRTLGVGDVLDFGAGVAVVGGPTLVSPPAGFTANSAWDGTIAHFLAGTANLPIATTMILNFTVRVQLAPGTTTAARDCTRATGEVGTGSLNLVIVEIRPEGKEQAAGALVATACAPLSTLTLKAQITNDNGGTLALSGVTLSATGGATLSGTSPVQGAVSTAPAILAGSDVAGYTKSAFTCSGGTIAGSAVTVDPGADAVCTIVYDDNPPATTTTTTVAPTSTLPKTGSRAAKASAGLAALLVTTGGLLVMLAGVRRRRHA